MLSVEPASCYLSHVTCFAAAAGVGDRRAMGKAYFDRKSMYVHGKKKNVAYPVNAYQNGQNMYIRILHLSVRVQRETTFF